LVGRRVSVEDVKPRILDVLKHYGAELDGQGFSQDWQWLHCPFHDDKRPSASVNVKLGRFNCHVCGISGDAIDLVQEMEHLDFKEALEWLTKL
jgi:DNA primase